MRKIVFFTFIATFIFYSVTHAHGNSLSLAPSEAEAKALWRVALPREILRFEFEGRGKKQNETRIFFSSHAAKEDAAWALAGLEMEIARLPQHAEIVLWMEHAYPLGLPYTVEELKRQIPETEIQNQNWYQILLSESLPDEVEEILRFMFEASLSTEGKELQDFLQNKDPFSSAIWQVAGRLRAEGKNIRIEIEAPNFDAYVNHLRQDAMGHLATHWIGTDNKVQALASLASSYRYFSKALDERDRSLAQQIKVDQNRFPRGIHFIFRGLAHAIDLPSTLNARGFSALSYFQPSAAQNDADIHHFLLKYRQLPSLENLPGLLFLSRQLVQLTQNVA